MADQTVIRTIRVRGVPEGIDELTGKLKQLAGAQENVAVVSEQSARRTLSLEASYKKQTMQLDENARNQSRIASATKVADGALREGLITQQQHAERLNLITQRYSNVINATDRFAKGTGLARHELINLSRQAQDVGVSLASGQSPFTVLIQQGSQIADVFASSQGSVRGFFSQAAGWAGTFLKSTGGIVTTVLAIGGAAIYAASQFARASTTIEQALEEQNRLLKEGKALLDQRTSLEARAQLQSKEQTQFETLRNQLDLQVKLNQAMEEAANISRRRATRPTEVPGEMGVAPTAFASLDSPGLDKMTAAFQALKDAQAAGLPGLKQYNAELAKIGLAHPELALVVQDMIKAGEEGLKLEFAAQRAKAMSDALAGIATNAQMAAVGLGSVAQFKANNLQAEQAAAATERQAVAILQLAQAYPGITTETAKQLDLLNAQTAVANARSAAEKQIAEEKLRQIQLSQQNIPAEERALIIAKERAMTIAQANAQAQERLNQLQLEGKLISDISEVEKARIAAAAQYQKDIANNVDPLKAGQIAAQSIANARATQDAAAAQKETANQMQRTAHFAEETAFEINQAKLRTSGLSWELRQVNGVLYSIAATWANFMKSGDVAFSVTGDAYGQGGTQFKTEGYKSTTQTLPLQYANTVYGAGGFDTKTFQPNATGTTNLVNAYLAGNRTIATAGWAEGGGVMGAIEGLLAGRTTGGGVMFGGGGLSPDTLQVVQRLTELLPDDQKAGVIEREIAMLRAQPQNLETLAAIKQLTDSLTQLRQSTDTLADAMTDVLSPFYATDPRQTHLGFRPFASGGIAMTETYARIAEREPEVVAPLSSLPAMLRQAANSNEPKTIIHAPVTVSMTANVSRDEARKTGFQIAQSIKRALG